MYLVRDNGKRARKSRAHIWVDGDSACRMWSTGGVKQQRRYKVCEEYGEHQVCQMCRIVFAKMEAR